MKLNLKNLPMTKAIDIVQHCWDNQIEPKKCMDFVFWSGDLDFEFDIPDQHITWMALKGYFNE